MKAVAIPCHKDNYAWILYRTGCRDALVIDACEGAPLLAALEKLGLMPSAVCCTHHHADHTGGLTELLEVSPQLSVFCHHSDMGRIAAATDGLDEGNFDFCGYRGEVLHTPGHTRGSVCYLFDEYLFTGDTLFGAGCGRMFEGQPQQMAASLQRLAALAMQTKVCFAHEYTHANLDFATFVEPENEAISARREVVAQKRQQGEVTTPSFLYEELESNPFLRCDDAEVVQIALQRFGAVSDRVEDVFAALRQAKDRF